MTGRPRLLDPSELTPLDLDLRRVFWTITGLWAIALVVVIALFVADSVPGRAVAVCATGFALGFAALGWERWRFGPRVPADVAPGGDGNPDEAGRPDTA